MENASNALLMAGAVLIGVLILSAGVYLFTQFSSTSHQISEQLTASQISQFNSQFTKYDGREDITAHTIVSICNLAKQNNEQYYGSSGRNSDPYYIQVILNNAGVDYNRNNLEKENEDFYQGFMKSNDIKYDIASAMMKKVTFTCTEVKINETTKLVNKITFKKN